MTTAITNSTLSSQTHALNTDTRPASESQVADFEAALNANTADNTVNPSSSSPTKEDVEKAIQDSIFKTMIMEMDKSTKRIQEAMKEES